jgi:hypothetical protein
MSKFKIWKHPANGAVRVYIQGFGQTKVWAEECPTDQFGFSYTIRAKNENKNRSELSNIVNDAECEIFSAAGARIKLFLDVQALAK